VSSAGGAADHAKGVMRAAEAPRIRILSMAAVYGIEKL
jgi:hypothetical protein